MKIGDLVRWTVVEECYHLACRAPGIPDVSGVRRCGVIVDKNPIYFFVRWENGDFKVAKPSTIEVISAAR